MATEAPWSDPTFANKLEQELGSDWEQQLKTKWGDNWQELCGQELTYDLGGDWTNNLDTAAEKLAELVADTGEEGSQLDPNEPLAVDLAEYPWLNSIAQSGSVQSWLTQLGVPDEQATALADESGGSGKPDETGTSTTGADPDQPLSVDLSQYEWLSTIADADSLHSWLSRVRVPDDLAAALVEGRVEEAPSTTTGTDPDQPLSVDLSQYEWLSTFADADSLHSWLNRVGVPEELAVALTEAAG